MLQKLKRLGTGSVAVLAIGAYGSMSATATTSGHFVSDLSHSVIEITESGPHQVQFSVDELPYICEKTAYAGTTGANTATSLTVVPTYDDCRTEGGSAGEITASTNGCTFVFASNSAASTHAPTGHATLTLTCPAGKAIALKHAGCEFIMPPQSLKAGATFTTTVNGTTGKHELTVNTTATDITTHYEAGACIFLGTSHKGSMVGSTTLKALNTAGEQVNYTAT